MQDGVDVLMAYPRELRPGIAAPSGLVAGKCCSTGQDTASRRWGKSRLKSSWQEAAGSWQQTPTRYQQAGGKNQQAAGSEHLAEGGRHSAAKAQADGLRAGGRGESRGLNDSITQETRRTGTTGSRPNFHLAAGSKPNFQLAGGSRQLAARKGQGGSRLSFQPAACTWQQFGRLVK